MKNRILTLSVLAACLFACTSDSMINDEVNLTSKTELKSKKNAVERPFKIRAAGTFIITPVFDEETCPALVLSAPGEGNATHMGRSILLEEWCWSGAPTDLGTRSLIITAANGDELWATPSTILFTSDTTFEEVAIIEGGTGRFENATGEFNESVAITFGDETQSFGTFTMSGLGTLSY